MEPLRSSWWCRGLWQALVAQVAQPGSQVLALGSHGKARLFTQVEHPPPPGGLRSGQRRGLAKVDESVNQ